MFLSHFDVFCDLLLDRCTATWNLFVLYDKELNFVGIKAALFHVRRAEVGPSPFWQTRKKPFDAIYDLHKMKQSHWLLCVGKELWTLGKLALAVNMEAIRFGFWTERSVSDGGNLCPLWSVILKSVWNSVGDTFKLRYSWPWAVVSCTLLADVPWNKLEHSHRKARLCVYLIKLSDFKKWCFDVSHS